MALETEVVGDRNRGSDGHGGGNVEAWRLMKTLKHRSIGDGSRTIGSSGGGDSKRNRDGGCGGGGIGNGAGGQQQQRREQAMVAGASQGFPD